MSSPASSSLTGIVPEQIAPEAIAALLEEAAARFILPRFGTLSADDIMRKGENDLVTIVDIETESFLEQELKKHCSDALFLGEESIHKNPDIEHDIHRHKHERPVWVVDPIDGTRNFSRGEALYCSMVALVVREQTVMGWIFDPVLRETIWAVRGEGCFTRKGAIPVPSSAPVLSKSGADLYAARGNISFRHIPRSFRRQIENQAKHFAQIRNLHCAGQDFLSLIRRESEFSIYAGMKSWDHAAPVLFVEEMGGRIGTIPVDGQKDHPSDAYSPLKPTGIVMVTAEKDSWPAFADAFTLRPADTESGEQEGT